jgi:hypothetical protein
MGNSSSLESPHSICSQLINRNIPITEQTYWEKCWLLPNTSIDVWTMLSDDLLRTIKQKQPQNFCRLLYQIINKLHSLITAAQTLNTSQIPIGIQSTQYKLLLNLFRILSRLIANLIEQPHSDLHTYIFGHTLPNIQNNEEFSLTGVFTHEQYGKLPLATTMMILLVDALFLPGFTIPIPGKMKKQQYIDMYIYLIK